MKDKTLEQAWYDRKHALETARVERDRAIDRAWRVYREAEAEAEGWFGQVKELLKETPTR